MEGIPEGAQLSEDGNYWWDGSEWQPVEGQSGQAGEVTAEHLEPVGDIGAEPGSDELITEELKPYFQPDVDGIADDDSEAELSEVLDDNEFAATSGEA
jgi:hypothetical protein